MLAPEPIVTTSEGAIAVLLQLGLAKNSDAPAKCSIKQPRPKAAEDRMLKPSEPHDRLFNSRMQDGGRNSYSSLEKP